MASEAVNSPVTGPEGQPDDAAAAAWEEQGWNEQSEDLTASHTPQHSEPHQEPANSVEPAPNSASSGEPPSDDDDEDAGEYDPESITFTTPASAVAPAPALAVEPGPEPKQEQEQDLPRPSKKPKTAGGFLVGSSDDEDEDEDDAPAPAPDTTTLKPAPATAQTQPFSPSPLQQSSTVQDTPAQVSNNENPVDSVSAAALVVEPPVDYVANLEDRIKEDPRGAVNAWLDLIREHRSQNRIDEARAVYERFFKTFPQAVSSPSTFHRDTETLIICADSHLGRLLEDGT